MRITVFNIFWLVTFTKCSTVPQKKALLIPQMITNDGPKESLLKYDGAYHYITSENYHHPLEYKNGVPIKFIDTPYLESPIFFFRNGNVLFVNSLILEKKNFFDTDALSTGEYPYRNQGWGTYNVINNNIYAIIFMDFVKGFLFRRGDRIACHFQGHLKDRNTILNWRMVSPYPNFKTRDPSNKEYADYMKKPLDLYYKETPEIKLIDPSKAWVNKK